MPPAPLLPSPSDWFAESAPTAEKITSRAARRFYNANVRDLNTRIQSFPDLLIARPLRFGEREFFELETAEEAAVPRFEMESGT